MTTTTAATTTTTTLPPRTTTTLRSFSPSDFSVELVIIESDCFNTAGALVRVEHALTLTAAVPADNQRVTVIFEIHGGENVETKSIDVTGSSYTVEDHRISTASCTYDLTAEVVNVLNR